MDSISQLFTPVMVIGSVLSVIFALGALYNSISRRRHLAMLAEAEKKEEKIVFKPLPAAPSPHEPAAGAARATKTSSQTASKMLFRQIRPSGAVEEPAVQSRNEDPYVWE